MATGSNEIRRAEAAWAAARRMVARTERPCYRVAEAGDGTTVHIIELPWIGPITGDRQSALEQARDAIADWLDVAPDAFDLERG